MSNKIVEKNFFISKKVTIYGWEIYLVSVIIIEIIKILIIIKLQNLSK
jgi:hypothetical protein